VKLVLGTAQFGLRYGVAGRDTPVPEDEARVILARAWALGIRVLDTAPAYGDIEQRLVGLTEGLPYRSVTKLGPLPENLPPEAAADWAQGVLERSHDRLGRQLEAVMFHRADDLLRPRAAAVWERCADWAARHGVRLGASVYDPTTLRLVGGRFGLQVAQVPGNAFDQRLMADPPHGATEQLHIRSAFLQGLLLMDPQLAAQRVPACATAVRRWHAWADTKQLQPLDAALSLVKALPGATHCVVGVDDVSQLEAIVAAWQRALPIAAPELAVGDPQVIDPRRWPSRA
jgi:aryl-alcohol dehydrogenase-like predicted oxidoreductase